MFINRLVRCEGRFPLERHWTCLLCLRYFHYLLNVLNFLDIYIKPKTLKRRNNRWIFTKKLIMNEVKNTSENKSFSDFD